MTYNYLPIFSDLFVKSIITPDDFPVIEFVIQMLWSLWFTGNVQIRQKQPLILPESGCSYLFYHQIIIFPNHYPYHISPYSIWCDLYALNSFISGLNFPRIMSYNYYSSILGGFWLQQDQISPYLCYYSRFVCLFWSSLKPAKFLVHQDNKRKEKSIYNSYKYNVLELAGIR